MPEIFPLFIFPEGGLAGSVVTTVWVGIAVVVFFNLRFGWVLSGLVVPGYLVPLLLAKPAAAFVVVGEGIATYGLVWFYSEYLSARLGWSNFFGRDRFFALVLCSILVRIIADGFLLPSFGEWLNQTVQLQFDYRNNLHSFGLIIVALIANNFWKTGLARGVLPLVVTVGITLLIVRYVLMPATNFNISSLSYAYEDIATSMLASPKAYIILIVTAFLASRMNLLYGWDFSGILVPSLLALQWYQPGKIAASFLEAGVIILLAHALLKLPVFASMTIEGGRKLLLFFNISYFYKFVLAYLMLWLWPEQKITDLYGFGYLLPTLIALKMHDKGIYARMTRATLQTSLVAALGATAVGFSLSFMPDIGELTATRQAEKPVSAEIGKETLLEALRREKILTYQSRLQKSVRVPSGFELDQFRSGLLRLDDYRLTRTASYLAEASQILDSIGYRIEILEGRYLLLRENEPRNFGGVYVIDLNARTNLAIEVPAPLDERGSMAAGISLFKALEAQSLAIGGSMRTANPDGSADVLASSQTRYQVFHQIFATKEVLQVRRYTTQSARLAGGIRKTPDEFETESPASTLWVKRRLPDGLDLDKLKSLMGGYEIHWGELPIPNLQRETIYSGFAELQLRSSDIRRLLGQAIRSEMTKVPLQKEIHGRLQDWLIAEKNHVARSGSNLYQKPRLEDLLFLDDEVLTPLIEIAAKLDRHGLLDPDVEEELDNIREAASVMGYSIFRLMDASSGSTYLILAEPAEGTTQSKRRYWGSYILRTGISHPFMIQAPRPSFDINALETAASMFDALNARVLMLGGASPMANQDGSADILDVNNKANLFNAASQALLKASGNTSLVIVQSRATGTRRDLPMPSADIVIATDRGAHRDDQLTPLGKQVTDFFTRRGLSYVFSDGSLETAGYEAGGIAQSFYLNATQNKELLVFWSSPLARPVFLNQTESTPQQAQATALGLTTVKETPVSYLQQHGNRMHPLPTSFKESLRPYFASQDIVTLYAALKQHPELRFARVTDPLSGQGFLSILDRQNRLLGLVNLAARDANTTVFLHDASTSLHEYIDSRAAWLLVSPNPAP
ncbi:MAG: poly-gamma-glutamate biosynthesis protein PgsC/CapC [Brachymonas sp.]|nr:poly-gamma-glutamate biosynthesis protein PgsC/CapC [Brachymonas sp.]